MRIDRPGTPFPKTVDGKSAEQTKDKATVAHHHRHHKPVAPRDAFDSGSPKKAPVVVKPDAGSVAANKNLSFSQREIAELGGMADKALDAFKALQQGDVKTALKDYNDIRQSSPDVADRLGKAVLASLPPDVAAKVSSLAQGADQLIQTLGPALPAAIDIAKSIQAGDWKAAVKGLVDLAKDQPGLARKVEDEVVGLIPQGLKDKIAAFGLDTATLSELGDALPAALDTLQAIETGDWKGALQGFKDLANAAPVLAQDLESKVTALVPQDVKDQLGKLGIDSETLSEVGDALPSLLDTAEAVKSGDWQGALQGLKAAAAAAPGLTAKIEDAVLSAVPQGVKDTIGKLGLDASSLTELGDALPKVLDTAKAVESGDWQGALAGLNDIAKAAPGLTAKIEDAVLSAVPQDVKDTLSKAGINAGSLSELGDALPKVLDTAKAVESGDWQAALSGLNDIAKAAPHLTEKVEAAVLSAVPQNVKDTLGKIGVDSATLGTLGKALPDVLDFAKAVQKGDGNVALGDIMKTLGDVSPGTRDKITGGIEKFLQLPAGGLANAIANGDTVTRGWSGSGGSVRTFGNQDLANGIDFHSNMLPNALSSAATSATDVTLAQGSVGWSGSLYSAQGSFGTPGGAFEGSGQVAFGQAMAQASGSVTGNLSNLTFGAQGHAEAALYAINASGTMTARVGPSTTTVSGNAVVGAYAKVDGTVKVDPLHGTMMADIGGEAFAGARAGVKVQETLGPVGVGGEFDVEAGIGAEFSLDVGFQKGNFTCKFDIGAALGIGFDWKVNFSIDFGALGKDLVKGIKALPDLGKAAIKDVGKAVGWLGSQASSAVKSATKAVGSAVKAVGNVVESAGKAVGNAAKSVGHAVASVFSGW